MKIECGAQLSIASKILFNFRAYRIVLAYVARADNYVYAAAARVKQNIPQPRPLAAFRQTPRSRLKPIGGLPLAALQLIANLVHCNLVV